MASKAECQCGLREHIEYMIKKCKLELDDLTNENLPLPQIYKIMGSDFVEERIEHLKGLQSTLQFMLDYPERRQIV